MTIEEKALKKWGITDSPELATWMLADGTLVNGSFMGFQRDIDHHEISQFFQRSKFAKPGENHIYIQKFLRRGNIRVGCNSCGYMVQMWNTPTKEQMRQIRRIADLAQRKGLEFCISKMHQNPKYCIRLMPYESYLSYLDKHHIKIA